MAKPIYKCFMARPTEAWYALSKEQQQQMMAKNDAAAEQAGAKMLLVCNSSWASDRITFFGIQEFPSIEAAQQYHQAIMAMEWFRYVDSQSMLGTKWE